jgi:hypothetical protein
MSILLVQILYDEDRYCLENEVLFIIRCFKNLYTYLAKISQGPDRKPYMIYLPYMVDVG